MAPLNKDIPFETDSDHSLSLEPVGTPPPFSPPPHQNADGGVPLNLSPALVLDIENDDEFDFISNSGLLTYSPIDLPVPKTLKQILTDAAQDEELRTVESLRLRVHFHEVSLQRICAYAPRLRELDLSGGVVPSLRELGCDMACLRVLRIASCGLATLDGAFGLPGLRELYAPDNAVSDVSPLVSLPDLQVLDLRRNNVSSIEGIGFLSICPDLRHLLLEDNNVAESLDYRTAVKLQIPHLSVLDATPYDESCAISVKEKENTCRTEQSINNNNNIRNCTNSQKKNLTTLNESSLNSFPDDSQSTVLNALQNPFKRRNIITLPPLECPVKGRAVSAIDSSVRPSNMLQSSLIRRPSSARPACLIDQIDDLETEINKLKCEDSILPTCSEECRTLQPNRNSKESGP